MSNKNSWWSALNRRLFPYLGPPPLGPYGEAPLPPVRDKACPLCGHPMADHEIERRDGRPTQIHCPDDSRYPATPDAEAAR
ncbi:MAG: hypothetical protein QOG18_2359 [Microbacteriaceae bacterium]|jgi:hypothetical protein|nr:hypothetical protein [Microbacteriaceae bacterium]